MVTMKYNTQNIGSDMTAFRQRKRVFLLSPALMNGVRAKQLMSPRAQFTAAQSFRSEAGVPIAEAFSFMSCLYFRGKIAYAIIRFREQHGSFKSMDDLKKLQLIDENLRLRIQPYLIIKNG